MPQPRKSGPNLAGYVEVADRIKMFYERYPEGSLQQAKPPEIMIVSDKEYLVYHAAAYRSPMDERPGHGTAWEVVPGKTNFTKDSEMMNAETSAWGRAIAALGIGLVADDGKVKVATREEVQNRQPDKPLPLTPLEEKRVEIKFLMMKMLEGIDAKDEPALWDRRRTAIKSIFLKRGVEPAGKTTQALLAGIPTLEIAIDIHDDFVAYLDDVA